MSHFAKLASTVALIAALAPFAALAGTNSGKAGQNPATYTVGNSDSAGH
ncbi:MAG: hypothetical protein KGJ73_10220 [Rhodospirillales bacterium]|nr:hypothetical protein [Rhodospirillales bacterium]